MKHIYFLLFCCFIMTSTIPAQTTITTKVGIGTSKPTYIYKGAKYHDEYGSSMNISLAFNYAVNPRFGMGTEFGFQAFQNYLQIKPSTKYVNGNHEHQQIYLALVPQYSLTKTPGLLCLNAGVAFFVDVKNELNNYSSVIPMSQGETLVNPGIFGGLSIYPHFGKLGLRFDIRHTIQDGQRSRLESATIPDKFRLHYTTVSFGFSYLFD